MNHLYFTLATYALALLSAKTSLVCYVVQNSDSESMRTADNGSLTLLIRKITLARETRNMRTCVRKFV